MGALPNPASLENTPRATPKRIAAQTAAPANPPCAATGVKADFTININASGIAVIFSASTTIPAPKYPTVIMGTNLPATSAIRLIPPINTAPTKITNAIAVTVVEIPKLLCKTSATEFACTVFINLTKTYR